MTVRWSNEDTSLPGAALGDGVAGGIAGCLLNVIPVPEDELKQRIFKWLIGLDTNLLGNAASEFCRFERG